MSTPWRAHVASARRHRLCVCTEDAFASGWEVITSVRRSQHRLEVFLDQSLEPIGQLRSVPRSRGDRSQPGDAQLSTRSVPSALPTSGPDDRPEAPLRGLVDLVHEPGRVDVRLSELGLRRLRLFRRFTHDSKAELEAELTGGERYQLTQLPARANDARKCPCRARMVARAVRHLSGSSFGPRRPRSPPAAPPAPPPRAAGAPGHRPPWLPRGSGARPP